MDSAALLEGWQAQSLLLLRQLERDHQGKLESVRSVASQPHKTLLVCMRAHARKLGHDPRISDTVALLETLVRESRDAEQRHGLEYVLALLRESMAFYTELMHNACCAAVFAPRERLRPGSTDAFFRAVTFGSALECPEFATYAHAALHPKLGFLRSVARGLRGLETHSRPSGVLASRMHKQAFELNDREQALHGDRSLLGALYGGSGAPAFASEHSRGLLDAAQFARSRAKVAAVKRALGSAQAALDADAAAEAVLARRAADYIAKLDDVVDQTRALRRTLATTKPAVPHPERPPHESVWAGVQLLLRDWRRVAAAGASPAELEAKRARQEAEVHDIVQSIHAARVAGITGSSFAPAAAANAPGALLAAIAAMRDEWSGALLRARLAPSLAGVLAEATAPKTHGLYADLVQRCRNARAEVEDGALALGATAGDLEAVLAAATTGFETLAPTDARHHAGTLEAWSGAASDAVRLDGSYFMAWFCDVLRARLGSAADALAFVDEQLAKPGSAQAVSRACCSALEASARDVAAEAAAVLERRYHAPLAANVLALEQHLEQLRAAVSQAEAERARVAGERFMRAVVALTTVALPDINALLEPRLCSFGEAERPRALEPLRAVYEDLRRAATRASAAAGAAPLLLNAQLQLVDAMREAHALYTARTLSLRAYALLASVLLAALSLRAWAQRLHTGSA